MRRSVALWRGYIVVSIVHSISYVAMPITTVWPRHAVSSRKRNATVSVDLVQTETCGGNAADYVPPSTKLKLCPNSTTVLIGRNGRGQWIARERHGLYGGLFVSRANAVRYALFENGHRPEAIVNVAGIVELDMSIAPTPEPQATSTVTALQNRAA